MCHCIFMLLCSLQHFPRKRKGSISESLTGEGLSKECFQLPTWKLKNNVRRAGNWTAENGQSLKWVHVQSNVSSIGLALPWPKFTKTEFLLCSAVHMTVRHPQYHEILSFFLKKKKKERKARERQFKKLITKGKTGYKTEQTNAKQTTQHLRAGPALED